jgi:hypothetical protein
MKVAALGIRVHSGWGALVAASGHAATVEIIERRRIILTDPSIPGANQPFHMAAKMELPEAQKYLSNCAETSENLALAAIGDVVRELHTRDYQVIGSVVLLASGRRLPALPEILGAHPLIHTAEGEFFRSSFWRACESLAIPVIGIRERDLDECAQAVFGKLANQVWRRISSLKNSLGSPWTEDQKKASFGAALFLADCGRKIPLSGNRPSFEIRS